MSGIPFPNISPELFSIDIAGFHLALRWYALAYIVGILLGWQIARVALGRDALWPGGKTPMSREQLESLMTWLILGIILGGRLGYVLFYQPGQYLSDPLSIIRVWEGGMSFHGGFAGVVIAILLFCRSQKIALGPVSDMIAMATPPGLLLGRLANFINAELWGRPTDLPWGVIFPGAQAQDCGQLAATLCARHPSQLYEAALEGLILGAVLLWLAFRRGALQRPWLISGLFFSGYGLARFVVEFVRQPDAQFVSPGNPLGLALQAGDLGLTMGQILSLPMIVIGIVVAIRAWRRG